MTFGKMAAWLFTGIALLVVLFALQEFQYIGFPDGFRDEWSDRREMLLATAIAASVLAGLWFCSIALRWSAKQSLARLLLCGALYLIVVIVIYYTDAYLAQFSGRGG